MVLRTYARSQLNRVNGALGTGVVGNMINSTYYTVVINISLYPAQTYTKIVRIAIIQRQFHNVSYSATCHNEASSKVSISPMELFCIFGRKRKVFSSIHKIKSFPIYNFGKPSHRQSSILIGYSG